MPIKKLRIMSKFGKQSEALKDLKEIVHSYERGGGGEGGGGGVSTFKLFLSPPPFFLERS